jgi:hypothetical protein
VLDGSPDRQVRPVLDGSPVFAEGDLGPEERRGTVGRRTCEVDGNAHHSTSCSRTCRNSSTRRRNRGSVQCKVGSRGR